MAIQVICSGCHSRFKVSDKFGGKKGPCPKCKAIIRIPTAEEQVVIHEPVHSEAGARTASGELVLKPLERKETKVNARLVGGVVLGAVAVLLIALVLRRAAAPPRLMIYVGAVLLAPPLVWAGYSFLRNDEELASFTGSALWIRTAICSAVYAGLWWAFAYFYVLFWGQEPATAMSVFPTAAPILAIGTATAYYCFDLDLGSSFFHYCLYLLVTILLRLVMGLPAVGPIESPAQQAISFVEHAATWLPSFL